MAKVVEVLYNKTDILDFQNGDVTDVLLWELSMTRKETAVKI